MQWIDCRCISFDKKALEKEFDDVFEDIPSIRLQILSN